MVDAHSLIDLDDGTTISYHTAKDSRTDNYHQSTGSIESDETTSTLHQSLIRDDLINSLQSPEESFYYDALASPSQSNQPPMSSTEKPNVLIDNLSNLLEEIETFNHAHHRSSLTTIDEEHFRLQPEGEEARHDIDRLIAIVDDIHRYHEIRANNSSTMDNLLFVYDQNDDGEEEEETKLPSNKMESLHESSNESSSCVHNLLFDYDDSVTPGDEPAKRIGQGSDEWSYDNLLMDDGEEVKTDHLGTIVHEALAARFQKPIKFKSTAEKAHSPVHTDNLGTIIHEALAARFQKPIKLRSQEPSGQPLSRAAFGEDFNESMRDTDNLEDVIHETLASAYQKPKTVKSIDHRDDVEQLQSPVDETPVDTDHLGTIVHEALAARFQKPVKVRSPQPSPNKTQGEGRGEPTRDTDNLEDVIHETLSTLYQKPKTRKSIDHRDDAEQFQSPADETLVDTDHLGTIVHEALAARSQKPIKIRSPEGSGQPSPNKTLGEDFREPMRDTDNLGDVIHEALATIYQKPKTVKSMEHRTDAEQFHSRTDETPVDTDHLGTIVHEALAVRFQKPVSVRSSIEDDHDVFFSESPAQSERDITRSEETGDRLGSESLEASFDQPIDETANEMEVTETITYEIESSLDLPHRSLQAFSGDTSSHPPVGHLSQIISDTLLASSNYQPHHRHQPREEQPTNRGGSSSLQLNITHQPLYDDEIYEEYGYRRTTTDGQSDDVVEKFEELCRRYSNSLEQYQSTTGKIDDDINQFEKQFYRQQHESAHTPTSETTSEELITTIERVIDMRDEEPRSLRNETDGYCSTLTVERQPHRLGNYGFDLKQTDDGKIQIASVTNTSYYPDLMGDDELVSVNHNRSFQSLEECEDLLESLWREHSEYVQITVIKAGHIPIPTSK